ncbi:MAG: enoyl-CoA hydratase/isomerase family protein [Spirochaetales bacterium]|nr:enoyl-CoA hydratase/isomerase family protein [Spirochaetales bacterium]
MAYNTIKFEKKDNYVIITIDRPKALNALNQEVLEELYQVFSMIEEDDSVAGAIVTGEGRAFVAGADISQMKDMNLFEGRKMAELGQRTMSRIESLSKPVIAAVNGFALGGGCELAIACDIRVASEKAKFGQPEVNLGILPGFGGTQRLSRLVGKGMAKYLILSAEMIDGAEALRIGLVERLTSPESLMEVAEKLLVTILSKGSVGVRLAKKAIDAGYEIDINSALGMEAEYFGLTFATEDQKEGMAAFLEKRNASFKGK